MDAWLSPKGPEDFPEQGRIRIDNEEVTYTGKTPTTFTGGARGARGTRAVAHDDNAVVNNAYKVILTELSSKIPILLEDKEVEYTIGVALIQACLPEWLYYHYFYFYDRLTW